MDLFRGLSLEDAQCILAFAEHRTFEAGTSMWQVGEPSPFMLVLLSGALQTQEPGRPSHRIEPGRTMGEMSCLTGHPRFVGLTAIEPSMALSLGRVHLRSLAEEIPRIYLQILENALDILTHRARGSSIAETHLSASPRFSLDPDV